MTTPSREEAPERVCLAIDSAGVRVWLDDSDDLDDFTDVTEYLRADLANREPSEGDVERVCRAMSIANHYDPDGPTIFSEKRNWERNIPVARAAINAWRNP